MELYNFELIDSLSYHKKEEEIQNNVMSPQWVSFITRLIKTSLNILKIVTSIRNRTLQLQNIQHAILLSISCQPKEIDYKSNHLLRLAPRLPQARMALVGL